MAKIIALTNQKGGVGKTTTCCAICGGLAQMGKKVLAIDLDPQGNLSFSLGIDDEEAYTIYDVFKGNCDISDAIQKGDICDVIPSNILLSGVELELTGVGREYILREQMETIRDEYDYILIDCAPSLGLITVNCLTAADSVIIPVQCEYFALEGISKLLNTIKIIKSKLNPRLEIEGFLLTMYDSRLRLANQIYDEVKRHFQELVFKTVIQRNVKLSESPSHGLPVILYDAESTGAKNHLNLAKEIIDKNM